MQDYENLEKNIDENTRILFFETVTNPQLEVVDIRKLVKIAKKHNILVIADSTLTPINVFSAKAFNIDVEIMSSTKFISGGGTSVGGIIVDTGVNDWSGPRILASFHEKKGEMALIAKSYARRSSAILAPRCLPGLHSCRAWASTSWSFGSNGHMRTA